MICPLSATHTVNSHDFTFRTDIAKYSSALLHTVHQEQWPRFWSFKRFFYAYRQHTVQLDILISIYSITCSIMFSSRYLRTPIREGRIPEIEGIN